MNPLTPMPQTREIRRYLAVQFFTPERVVSKVIDFVKNPDESAEGMVKIT